MRLLYRELATPVGPLTIVGTDTHVVRIDYGQYTDLKPLLDSWSERYMEEPVFAGRSNRVIDLAADELDDYFMGSSFNFSFPFRYYGTSFQQQVWQALYMTIPFGTTKSYKAVADVISNPKAVRAVGGAVNKNPLTIVVPCHRVIGQNGQLVGYNGGVDTKAYLLKHEHEQLKLVTGQQR